MSQTKSNWKYYQVSSLEQQQKNWADSIKHICTIKSMPELLSTLDQIEIAGLDNFLDLNLFKQNIQPMWEDPNNINGGRVILELPLNQKELLHEIWVRTSIFCALEPFECINGCVYSEKANYRICLWIGDSNMSEDIMAAWKHILDCSHAMFSYSSHNKTGDSYRNKRKVLNRNKERSG